MVWGNTRLDDARFRLRTHRWRRQGRDRLADERQFRADAADRGRVRKADRKKSIPTAQGAAHAMAGLPSGHMIREPVVAVDLMTFVEEQLGQMIADESRSAGD